MTDTVDRLSGAVRDRYRVERELGSGGMATVYLAEDVKHHRRVAIKVLHPELSAVLGTDRFLKEIALTASLQHPNILPLFDSGSADGLLYYVMPYVEGDTLRDRLTHERQLPVADAARISAEVAGALAYAHKHGVIHRDIKPENILLQDGRALVADFGIALAVEQAGGQRITQTGLSLGTPQYMSPEQATGEREIGPRSDVYSLGAVTYEMLIGEPPFTGPTAQAIVAKVITEEPKRLIPQRRSIQPALEDAVLTSLEKLPADRFDSAAAFGQALTDSQTDSGRTTGSRRGSRQAATPAYRSPAVWLAGAVIAAAAYLLGARVTQSRSPIAGFGRASKVTWEPGLEIHPALSPDGHYVAYAFGTTSDMRIYVRQVAGGRPTRLTDDSLTVQNNPSWSPDGSRVLFLSNGGVFSAPSSGGMAHLEMPVAARSGIVSAVWGPDGRTIAFAAGDSLYIRSPAGQNRPLARIHEPSLCQWSPGGGALIACVSENSFYSRITRTFGNLSPSRIVVVRLRDGATRVITDSTTINQSPAWSHDGKWLYFVSSRLGPRDIYAVRVTADGQADGAPVRLTTGLGAHTISVAANDTRFAYDVYTTTANVWSLRFPPNGATQATATPLTSGTQIIEAVHPSADGKWLYYGSDVSGASSLYRQRLPTGEPERLTFGPSDDFEPTPAPDGRSIAFHSWRSGMRQIYVMPLDGGPVQQVTALPSGGALPSWAPDGKGITFAAFPDHGVWVVRQGANGVWGTPVERTQSGTWPAWSPDGRWIAYASATSGGSLMLITPDSGAARTVLDAATSDGVFAESVVWSSDSRTIYFKAHDVAGRATFWSIPLAGGRPTLVLRFDDLTRPSDRAEWSAGSGHMYYATDNRQSNVWVMEAAPASPAR
jgi:serine/threonine-protein kinase